LATCLPHSWYLALTAGYLSSGASINLFTVASSLGGFTSRLYWIPVVGSILLLARRRIDSSSGYSKMNTAEGLILIAFNRLICGSDSGKPSITQPLTLQSLCFNLASIRELMITSGIGSPLSMHFEIIFPLSGFSRNSTLSKSLTETLTSPN